LFELLISKLKRRPQKLLLQEWEWKQKRRVGKLWEEPV